MIHGIHSGLLSLPSELKHLIAELSSHDSLASLARTHTALQREAEQALYRTLSNPSLNCLETLATNSEKAGFVRFLATNYIHMNNDYGKPAINCLLNALVDMHSLTDFRVRLPRRYGHKSCTKTQESLSEIMCDDHFRLQTLHLNGEFVHGISRIIKSQIELKILGIYYEYYDNKLEILETLKQLQNAQLHLPVVMALDRNIYGELNSITIFPEFNSIDRHPTIYQILVEYLDEDQSPYMLAYEDKVCALSIYLVDSCDLSSIHVLTKNMTMTRKFPTINYLTFCFENSREIPSQEMKGILSLFPNLYELDFDLRSESPGNWNKEDGKVPEEIKMAHVKDWELVCPELNSVSFTDGSMLEKSHREWILGARPDL